MRKNSAIQKPTTAVRQTESRRGESSEGVHMRERVAENYRRQYETWQEKRGERSGKAERARNCAYENL